MIPQGRTCHVRIYGISRAPCRFGSFPSQRHALQACASEAATQRNVGQAERLPPWLLGTEHDGQFKLGNAAQIQLVKIHAAAKLGKDSGEVDMQLACLGMVIPDFASMLSAMSASLLLALMTDPQGVARKMANLKAMLPELDISGLVARCPYLVIATDLDMISTSIGELRRLLRGKADAEELICRQPMLLLADVEAVILHAQCFVLPPGEDAVEALVANPDYLLQAWDMQSMKY